MIIKQILLLIFFYFLLIYTYILGVPALLLNNTKILKIVKNFGQNLSIYIINNLDIQIYLAETEQEIIFNNSNLIDIIICNHQSSTDFIILISLLKYFNIYEYNFILKKSINYIPGLGFIMYSNTDIKINRKWEDDKELINSQLSNIINDDLNITDNNIKKVLIIFPEGTRLNEKKLLESQQYAIENNYEKYNNLLFPKTKGLWYIINYLSDNNLLGKIWDFTMIYSIKNSLSNLSNELNSIYFIIKEIKLPDNYQDKDEFKKWFLNIWTIKDNIINNHKNIIYKKINIEYDILILKIINYLFIFSILLLSNHYGRIYLLISFILSYILMLKKN